MWSYLWKKVLICDDDSVVRRIVWRLMRVCVKRYNLLFLILLIRVYCNINDGALAPFQCVNISLVKHGSKYGRKLLFCDSRSLGQSDI